MDLFQIGCLVGIDDGHVPVDQSLLSNLLEGLGVAQRVREFRLQLIILLPLILPASLLHELEGRRGLRGVEQAFVQTLD